MEDTGGTPETSVYNLIYYNNLTSIRRSVGERPEALANAVPAEPVAVRNWSDFSVLTALLLLSTTPLAVTGCGHATVPCPTPTSELDRLRDETEGARAETDRAEAEGAALEARREAAAERVAAGQAALDSLGALEAGKDR